MLGGGGCWGDKGNTEVHRTGFRVGTGEGVAVGGWGTGRKEM